MEDGKQALHRLTYFSATRTVTPDGEEQRVWVEEKVYRLDVVWKGIVSHRSSAPSRTSSSAETMTAVIPVYHFKNRDWQGDEPFGSSELRGYERLFGRDQSNHDRRRARPGARGSWRVRH
jgi:hypothetical protein